MRRWAVVLLAVGGCTPKRSDAPPPDASTPRAAPDLSACAQLLGDRRREVQEHMNAARKKMSARDGRGCLAELDACDRLDPWTLGGPTMNAESPMAMTRGMCEMLAGNCAGGRKLYRDALGNSAGATMGPEMLDTSVDSVASLYCEGPALGDRDALLKALMDLSQGAWMSKKDARMCRAAYDTAKRLIPVVKPNGPDDASINGAPDQLMTSAPACLGRADDCSGAWTVFREAWAANPRTARSNADDKTLRTTFEGIVSRCGGR